MFHPPHTPASRQVDPLSETQLVAALHELGDGVLFLDSAWRVRYANRAAERLSAAPGSSFRERFPELDHDVLDEAFDRVVRTRLASTTRHWMPGTERWLELRAEPTADGVAVILRDVTADEHSRARLLESTAQLTVRGALLHAARDGIVLCDLDGIVQYWNPAAEAIYGWTAEEALGEHYDALTVTDDGVADAIATELAREGHWAGEIAQSTRHGSRRRIDSRRQLILNDRGDAVSVLAVNTDVTDARLAEEGRVRAQRMQSLGTLAGGIAHNLNNILTPILMSVQMLDRDESDPRRRDTLRMMERGIVRGADMIRQVLSFARGADSEHALLDTHALLDEFVQFCHETLPSSIRVTQRVDRHLPPLMGDDTQLMQVLVNLATNARDAMPDGGELILEARQEGEWVRVSLTDTGVGMTPEVISHIFEPFYTTKGVGQGTGLGLPTLQAIVASHGGRSDVASEPGAGTTFTLWFPVGDGVVPSEPADVRSHRFELAPGRGERILVIDDDSDIARTVSELLDGAGYSTITAADGRAGLDALAAADPPVQLVLTDVSMPILDGAGVIAHILQHRPELRVIAASGFTSNDAIARAVDAGDVAFLAKPFTAPALLNAVRAALDSPARAPRL
ncbi:MAG: ATP-binding protein [Microcella sp.]|uniref:PAS domain-containing hybrid sensor histidine kinase/response regulator n=1 Tax=Microcella sp. TaxID=1913979 RepID=UPI003315D13F